MHGLATKEVDDCFQYSLYRLLSVLVRFQSIASNTVFYVLVSLQKEKKVYKGCCVRDQRTKDWFEDLWDHMKESIDGLSFLWCWKFVCMTRPQKRLMTVSNMASIVYFQVVVSFQSKFRRQNQFWQWSKYKRWYLKSIWPAEKGTCSDKTERSWQKYFQGLWYQVWNICFP